jgi:hypothetical protein
MTQQEKDAEEQGYRAAKNGEPPSQYPTSAQSKDKRISSAFYRGYMRGMKEASHA